MFEESLREQKAEDRNYKNNILNVTPEFQNFVAKRLSELLDKYVPYTESNYPISEILSYRLNLIFVVELSKSATKMSILLLRNRLVALDYSKNQNEC